MDAVKDGMEAPQILLGQGFGTLLLGSPQLLLIRGHLPDMVGGPAPLPDPVLGIGRIVPEDLLRLDPGGIRTPGEPATPQTFPHHLPFQRLPAVHPTSPPRPYSPR